MVKDFKLLSAISSTLNGALKLPEELINVNIYTSHLGGENRAQDCIQQFLSQLELDVERENVPGCGELLIARLAGSRRIANVVLWLTHQASR